MKFHLPYDGAISLASAIRSREISAVEALRASLDRIKSASTSLNAFTHVMGESAILEAEAIDRAISRGEDPGPLAGVPFAVKNLFDIAGLPTLAGSKIRVNAPPPEQDATAVAALRRAGAVLVGALNMNEFAFGITGENTHYGTTRNPHDLSRVSGGSSGGSAAAVAAGLVPLTLGSDTNGSIRVPSAFCGIFGLKPTYGRLSRAGAFLFAGSFDTIGPLARFVEDLALTFDILQGPDSRDPVCTTRPPEPCSPELRRGAADLRVAIADDYFKGQGEPAVFEAVALVARALAARATVHIPEAARARAAAAIITGSEGGNHHLSDLRTKAAGYDPLTRSRFLSGALIPASWVSFAQRFRAWYRERVREILESVDVILAPTTPCAAIKIGQDILVVDGKEIPPRSHIAIFTQPISFIGLPVVTVPVHMPGCLPMGVQLIAAPYQEVKLLRVAYQLESEGIVAAPVSPVC